MASEFELSQPGLDKLLSSLDKLVDSMDRLQKSVNKLSATKPVFEQIFGTQAKFDSLIASLGKINAVGVDGFARIAKALQDLTQAVGGTKVSLTFRRFVDIVAESIIKLNSVSFDTAKIVGIRSLIDSLVYVSEKAQQIKPGTSLIKFAVGLGTAFATFDTLQLNNTAQIKVAFRDLIDLIASIKLESGGELIVKSVASIVKSLTSVITTVNTTSALVKAGSLTGLESFAVGLKAILAGLAESLVFLSAADIGENATKQFSQIIKFIKTLADVDKANLGDLSLFGTAIKSIFSEIGAAIASISTFDESSVDKVSSFILRISKIFSAIKDVNILTKTSTFITTIKELFKSLASLPEAISSLSILEGEQLNTITSVFAKLGEAFKKLTAVFGDSNKFDRKAVLRLQSTFTQLAASFQIIGVISGALPGLESLDDLSKIFQKIGSSFKNLAEAGKLLDSSVIRRVTSAFLQLTATFKLFSVLLKLVPGGSALSTLSETLLNLSTGLKNLADLGTKGGLDKASLGNIQQLIKIIKPLFGSLKGIDANLPDFGIVFAQIGTGIEKIAATDFAGFDARGLAKTVKSLAGALEVLSGSNVDPAKLTAIAQGLTALKDAGALNGNAQLAGALFGQNFTAGLFKAIILADIAEFVGIQLLTAAREFNPASLFLKLDEALRQTIGRAGEFLTNLGTQLRDFGQNVINVGQSILNNFGIGKLFDFGNAAIEFDSLSNQIQTFGRLTDEQLSTAQDFANELGIKYPISANEALQSILNLTKAGQNLPNIQSILPSAADLAALSDTGSIENTTNLLIAVANGFTKFTQDIPAGFDNISVAADIIANVADATTASIEDITASLQNVGPVAAQYNLSLADTASIIGVLSEQQLKGAEAGTALKSALTNLTTTTAQNELKKLGVSLTDEQGNFRDFNAIITDLSTSLSSTKTIRIPGTTPQNSAEIAEVQKQLERAARQLFLWQNGLASGSGDPAKAAEKVAEYQRQIASANTALATLTGSQETANYVTREVTRTQQQNAESIKKIFGSYGQVAGGILLAADGFGDLREEILNSGTAAERAQLLLNDLRGDMEQLSGSTDTLRTRAFLPLIDRAMRPLVQLARLIVDGLNSLSDSAFDVISTMILLGSSIATVIGGLFVFVGVVTTAASTILTLVGGAALLIFHITEVAFAFVSVVASLVAFVAIAAVALTAFTAISTAVSTLFTVIEDNVGGAGDAFASLKTTITDIFSTIGEIFSIGADIFSSIFGAGLTENNVALGERVAAFFSGINDQLLIFKDRIDTVKSFFEGLSSFIALGKTSPDDLFNQFSAQMPGAPEVVILSRVNDEIDRLSTSVNRAAIFLAGTPLIQALFPGDVSADDIVAVFSDIQTALTNFATNANSVLSGGTSLLLDFLGINDLNDKQFSEVSSKVRDSLGEIAAQVARFFQNTTGLDLADAIFNFENADLSAGAASLLDSLLSGLKTAIANSKGLILNVLEALFRFSLPNTYAIPFLRLLGLDNAADLAQSISNDIVSVLLNLSGSLIDVFTQGVPLSEALFNNFGDGIKPVVILIESLSKVADGLIAIFQGVLDVLFPGGSTSDKSFLQTLFDSVVPAFQAFSTVLNTIASALYVVAPLISGFLSLLTSSGLLSVLTPLVSGFGALSVAFTALGKPELLTRILNFVQRFASSLISFVVPLLAIGAAVVGFKSFFDALAEGGDVGDVVANTIGNFVTTIGDLFGLEIDQTQIDDLTNTLGNAINSAIAAIPDTLIGLGDSLGAPILSAIGTSLKTGDFTSVATTIADTIKSLLNTASQSLISVGDSLGIPIISALGTALQSGDFSPVLAAISDGITSFIASVPGTIASIGEALNSPIISAVGDALAAGDFNGALGAILTGLVSAIQSAGTSLTQFGIDIGSPLMESIGGFLETGDLTPVITSLIDSLRAARISAGESLSAFGEEIGSQAITDIGAAIAAGDATPLFESLGNLVREGITAAGTTLQTIGDSLGLSLISAIGTFLQTGDISGIFAAIQNNAVFTDVGSFLVTIGNNIGSALITQIGESLTVSDFSGITDALTLGIQDALTLVGNFIEGVLFPDSDGETTIIDRVVTSLSTLVGIPLEIIGQIAELVAGIVETIASGNPLPLILIGGALAGIVLLNFTSFVGFLGALVTAAAPILGVAAALLVLKGALAGINEGIEQHSAARGVGAAIVDVGSTALGLIGINTDPEGLTATFNQVLTIIELFLRRTGLTVSRELQFLGDAIVGALSLVATNILGIMDGLIVKLADAGLGDTLSNIGIDVDAARIGQKAADALNGINQAFTDAAKGTDFQGFDLFGELFNNIQTAQSSEDPRFIETAERLLRLNVGAVLARFNEILPNIEGLSSDQLGQLTTVLIGSGKFEEAAAQIAQDNPDFLQNFIQSAIDSGSIGEVDMSKALETLSLNAQAGLISADQAQKVVNALFGSGQITEEQAKQALTDLITSINFQSLGDDATLQAAIADSFSQIDAIKAGLPIEVTPNLEITEEQKAEAIDSLYNEFTGLSTQEGAAIFLGDLLKFETTGLITPEEAQQYREQVAVAFGAVEPVQTDTPIVVTPDPTVNTEGLGEEISTDIEATTPNGVETTVPVNVTPDVTVVPGSFDGLAASDDASSANAISIPVTFDAINSEATATAFADALTAVNEQADAALLSLSTLSLTTSTLDEDFTLISESVGLFVTDTTAAADTIVILVQNMDAAWFNHQTVVASAVGVIQSTIGTLGNGLLTYRAFLGIATNDTIILLQRQQLAWQTLTSLVNLGLLQIIDKAKTLDNVLASILEKIDRIISPQAVVDGLAGAVPGGNSGAGGNIPGRAGGGDVFANRLYEVAEGGVSELLKIGGRTYLIPGANGTVVPPTPSNFAAAPTGVSYVGSGDSIDARQYFDIAVSVTGETAADPAAIASAVRVEFEQRGGTKPPLNRRLARSGRR